MVKAMDFGRWIVRRTGRLRSRVSLMVIATRKAKEKGLIDTDGSTEGLL